MLSQLVDLDSFKIQKGLSRTFCGHTYGKGVRQVLSHICLDTGAFVSLGDYEKDVSCYGLTLFYVKENQWVSASYGKVGVRFG